VCLQLAYQKVVSGEAMLFHSQTHNPG